MSATTSSTVNDLLELLQRLRSEEEVLTKEIEARRADVRGKMLAVQTTLGLLTKEERGDRAPLPTNGWAEKLKGLTHEAGLMRLAKENDGLVKVSEARRIFIAAGLARGNPKHVGPHLYHLLTKSEDFERVAPGTFR